MNNTMERGPDSEPDESAGTLMSAPAVATLDQLAGWIQACGGGFVGASVMRSLLLAQGAPALADWPAFAASWDDMPVDAYMGDGGTYRSRRYATFSATSPGHIVLEEHQPHHQTLAYNRLNGGIDRMFEPIPAAVARGASLSAVLRFGVELFDRIAPQCPWRIEVHQFRIRARRGELGLPTPEGVHRDGVDFVLVLLVRRFNVLSGTTTVHDAARRQLGSFTLTEALDAALIDDRRCYHGVTPVEQIDASLPAFRDVLVATFRRKKDVAA